VFEGLTRYELASERLTPPGVSKIFEKRDTPENLWVKCPISGEMVFNKDLEAAHVRHAGRSSYAHRSGPAFQIHL
jgi:acetyl-CoA carboxylase carboxyl transferase subunit beta